MKKQILVCAVASVALLGIGPVRAGEIITGGFPPEPGLDAFPISLAAIGLDLTLNGVPDGEINAEGPFLVQRSAPTRGADGRNVIDTEIVQMDLTGSSPWGPVTIRTNPDRVSHGKIFGKDPEMDYPANSFFDIFVEIEIGELVLVNENPIRMEAIITEIPPKITIYRVFQDPIIPLTNGDGQIVALLLHVAHAPNPDTPIEPRDLKVLIERVQLQLELVNKKLELLTRIRSVGFTSWLLFPFNVSVSGALETGIAVTNITQEVQGGGPYIQPKIGRCEFYLYPAANPFSRIVVEGEDLSGVGTGLDPQGNIPPGGTYSVLVGELLRAAGRSGPFSGQIFAHCNFPAAQGINFISDSQFSTQSQGYPAIVIK